MAHETQTSLQSQDYEREVYDQLTDLYGPGAPLPDPVAGRQWPTTLEQDAELQRLAQEKEDRLNAAIAGEPDPSNIRIYDHRAGELRAQTRQEITNRINDKWWDRRKVLAEQSHKP